MTMSFRCVCVIAMVWAGAALAGERPSVVVIVADDLGWADVGYHGAPFPTPNIDGVEKGEAYIFGSTPAGGTGGWPGQAAWGCPGTNRRE